MYRRRIYARAESPTGLITGVAVRQLPTDNNVDGVKPQLLRLVDRIVIMESSRVLKQ